MNDDNVADLRTVGRTRSAFELDHERTHEDPFAGLGDPDEGGVVVGDMLGAGGMGVVRVGTQTSMRRQVAVKQSLSRDADGSVAPMLAFVREAWITANLEHPNVIPVHTLCSERGDPRLVMKLVEGVSWRELLDDDVLAARHGMRDRLAFHLDILVRVCRAVHFAHTRGVVHLDLKPANVMVGHHGEVYLLDWGIAASFRADAEPWMPRTAEIDDVRGTPSYLSPEQARGQGGLIGPRTDVFLLGGLIHRIVQGRPPHRGETMDDVIVEAQRYRPIRYGDDVPAELGAIILRAMATSPDQRYASADELRVALLAFLQHADSAAVLDAALARLERLRAATVGEGATGALDAIAQQRLENECRFGIEEALAEWPDNQRARAALVDLDRIVVERALRAGDWRRAAAVMERLPQADEALADRVRLLRAAERERERERAALHDLGSHQDILRNARTRSNVAAVVSVAWIVWFTLVAWAVRAGMMVLTHELLLLNAVVSLGAYAAVAWRVRDTLLATQIDRRAVLLMAASLGGVAFLWTLCWRMGIAPVHTLALSSGVYMFFFVAITMVMERRLAWVTVALAPLAFVSFFDPGHALEWQGITVLLGGSALSWIWRRDARMAAAPSGDVDG